MRSGAVGLNLSDSVYERLLAERIIFLGSQVDDDIANRLCAQILLLAAEDPIKDISLYINSPGGSISAGMAIYDTMVLAPCDIATYAMGMAASMGEFLLAAGAKGKRYALPHARILMHQPLGGITGGAADIAIQAEQFNVQVNPIDVSQGAPLACAGYGSIVTVTAPMGFAAAAAAIDLLLQ
jgi:ATP-dependent Clp protease protease subunit